jgi:hypothetical protein
MSRIANKRLLLAIVFNMLVYLVGIAFLASLVGCMNVDGIGIVKGSYGGMREAWLGEADYCFMVNGPAYSEMTEQAQLEFIRTCGSTPQ